MSTLSRKLEPLMAIIAELRKTIVELTNRLARYENFNFIALDQAQAQVQVHAHSSQGGAPTSQSEFFQSKM